MGKAKNMGPSGTLAPEDSGVLSAVSLQLVPPFELNIDAPEERYQKLSHIIAEHTIPRLLVLHVDATAKSLPAAAIDIDDVHELGRLILGPDPDIAAGFVLRLRDRGLSLDDLHSMLLGPTASYLGELWDQDRIDFVDVTLGVARLQRLVLTFEKLDDLLTGEENMKIMTVGVPGERHNLGNMIIQRSFRASGWQVWNCIAPRFEDVAQIAAENWFGIIGFSLSSYTHFEALRNAIRAIRQTSLNRNVGIILGGSAINRNPQWVAQLGADGAAESGPTAVLLANRLLAEASK